MPFGNEDIVKKINIMIYGEPKTRKSWWTLNSALAGFNVLYLDGNNEAEIINFLDKSIRSRIRVIPCGDSVTMPLFANFMTRLCANYTMVWNDTEGKMLTTIDRIKPECAHFEIQLSRMTNNDVLIIENIGALVHSIMWTSLRERNIEIEAGKKLDWDYYGHTGLLVTWMLNVLRSAPCHVIIINHLIVNEKSEPVLNEKTKEIVRVPTGDVVSQPRSSSRAHGSDMGKHFGTLLRTYLKGNTVWLTTKTEEGFQAGSRLIYEETTWDKLQFGRFTDVIGVKGDPTLPMPGCIYYPPGELKLWPGSKAPSIVKPSTPAPTLQTGNGTGTQPTDATKTEPMKMNISLQPRK